MRVVQADVGGDEWLERVAKSKFRNREGFGANREGRIFLQDHGNPVWYRNIVLVPLNCDQVVSTNSCQSSPSARRGFLLPGHRMPRRVCRPGIRPLRVRRGR